MYLLIKAMKCIIPSMAETSCLMRVSEHFQVKYGFTRKNEISWEISKTGRNTEISFLPK